MASIISAITQSAVAFDQNFRSAKKQAEAEQERQEDRAQAKKEHAEDRAFQGSQRELALKSSRMAVEDQELARDTRTFSNASTMHGYIDDYDPHDDPDGGIVPYLTNAVTSGQRAIDDIHRVTDIQLPSDPTRPEPKQAGPDSQTASTSPAPGGPTQPVNPGNLRMAQVPKGAAPVTMSRGPAVSTQVRPGAPGQTGAITDLGGKNTTDSKQVAAVFSGYGMDYLAKESNRQRAGYETTKGRMRAQFQALQASASYRALDDLGKAREEEKLWLRFAPGIQQAEARWNEANKHLQQAQARFQIGGALSAMNSMDFSSPEALTKAINEARQKFPNADWSALQGATAVTEHGSVYLKDKSGEMWSPMILKMVAAGAIPYDKAMEEMRNVRTARKDLFAEDMKSKDKALDRGLNLQMHREDLADRKAGRDAKSGDDALTKAWNDYNESVSEMQKIEKEKGLDAAQQDSKWQAANQQKFLHQQRVDLARSKNTANDIKRERVNAQNEHLVARDAFGTVEKQLHELARSKAPVTKESVDLLQKAAILAAQDFSNRGGSTRQANAWLTGTMASIASKIPNEAERQKVTAAIQVGVGSTTFQRTGEQTQKLQLAR